jgi:hypothetical protein
MQAIVRHFWNHYNNFYRVICVQMFMVNNLILNTLNDDWSETNNLIMKTISELSFENNAFIINSGLLKFKIWIG